MGGSSRLPEGLRCRSDAELALQSSSSGQQQRLWPLPAAVRGEFPAGKTIICRGFDFTVSHIVAKSNRTFLPPGFSGPRGSLRPPSTSTTLVSTAAGAEETGRNPQPGAEPLPASKPG